MYNKRKIILFEYGFTIYQLKLKIMKKILRFAAILLVMASAFTCAKEKENEPIEIFFTEYSLAGASCRWTNFDLGKVTIINSNAALEEYVTCTEGTFPEIDFSKNTLLRAGGTSHSVHKITFYQNSADKYTLNITLSYNFTMIAVGWSIGIVVPKLPNNAEINLNVQLIKPF
jgi:hypothetical protein